MKNITEFLSIDESRELDVNIIVFASGSMYDQLDEVSKIAKNFKSVKFYEVHDDGKINSVSDIKSIKVSGGHSDAFEDIAKFYQKHIGELNILVGN